MAGAPPRRARTAASNGRRDHGETRPSLRDRGDRDIGCSAREVGRQPGAEQHLVRQEVVGGGGGIAAHRQRRAGVEFGEESGGDHHEVEPAGEARLGRLTALVGAGYFFMWAVLGMAAFPLGTALAAIEMQQPALARAVPIISGMVVLIAGAVQFTAWKARHLACCRETPGSGRALRADSCTAWLHGLRLGLHCSCCTAGLTAILLALGVMNLKVMALVTAATTVERLAPVGDRVARGIGAVVLAAGLLLIARACL